MTVHPSKPGLEPLADERILTRNLRPEDLGAVIALDARHTGRRRAEFFQLKLEQALSDTGVMISLCAELEDLFVGFLLGRVFYGEFGQAEPVAVLDTIGVHPDFRRRGVGRALVAQLTTNLKALGIERLQTEVSWEDQQMLRFCHRLGFRPAARLCLDLDLSG